MHLHAHDLATTVYCSFYNAAHDSQSTLSAELCKFSRQAIIESCSNAVPRLARNSEEATEAVGARTIVSSTDPFG